jgi:hypothetical protein
MSSLMATGLMATPFAEPDETNVYELKVEQRKGGSVVQYGEVKRSLVLRAECGGWFQKKCPPKTCHITPLLNPKCDSKNGGTNAVCDALVNDIYGNREKKLEEGARQLCWQNENGKTGCCIKWTEDVKDITKGDLIEHADYSTQMPSPGSLNLFVRATLLTFRSQGNLRQQRHFGEVQNGPHPKSMHVFLHVQRCWMQGRGRLLLSGKRRVIIVVCACALASSTSLVFFFGHVLSFGCCKCDV